MSLITIKKNTTIEDIGKWHDVRDSVISFKINVNSSFQTFAEGVAIGMLKTFYTDEKEINIVITKNPVENESVNLNNVQPLFKTLFGLELLRIATKVYGENKDLLKIGAILGNAIWKNILNSNGSLVDGKNVYLISRHGYNIPKCLRQQAFLDEFPRYDYFQSTFSKYIRGLRGYSKYLNQSENKLIEWLHHVWENSFEHGSKSFENDLDGEFIDGFRGIILGKYYFGRENEFEERDDYPILIKNYIRNLIAENKCPTHDFTCSYASVIDLGDGIQNTIKNHNTSGEFEMFKHAFKDNVTRKTINERNEKSGFGLGSAVEAASKINALFHIVSSNLITKIDRINKNGEVEFSAPTFISKKYGTSVSIFWLNNN